MAMSPSGREALGLSGRTGIPTCTGNEEALGMTCRALGDEVTVTCVVRGSIFGKVGGKTHGRGESRTYTGIGIVRLGNVEHARSERADLVFPLTRRESTHVSSRPCHITCPRRFRECGCRTERGYRAFEGRCGFKHRREVRSCSRDITDGARDDPACSRH